MTISINYADGGTFDQHKALVIANSEQIIDEIIQARVNNGLVGKAREAAIATLKTKFQANLLELNAILTKLSTGVNTGMDNFRNADNQGQQAFS